MKKSALEIGKKLSMTTSFTKKDVEMFSMLSGDKNQLHLNDDFAKKSIFKAPICHGMLVGSLFSNLIGNNFPMAIYLSQSLKFKAPVYINESVTAEVTIESIKNNKIVTLNTQVWKFGEINIQEVKKDKNSREKIIVIDGQAVVMINEII